MGELMQFNEGRINERDATIMEKAIMGGDLSGLTAKERLFYYHRVCQSVGLNPLTKPFTYLKLNGKLVLYPNKECAEQLRMVNRISIKITSRQSIGDIYTVSAYAEDTRGRCDEATAAVNLNSLCGQDLANALMKCETKAKRRVTFSICGLTWLADIADQADMNKAPAEAETRSQLNDDMPIDADPSVADIIDPEEMKKEYQDKERFYNIMHAWAQENSFDWRDIKRIVDEALDALQKEHRTISWPKMLQPKWIEAMKKRVAKEYLDTQLPPLDADGENQQHTLREPGED